MNKINVLVTAGGSPGAPGIIKSLKLNGEREIRKFIVRIQISPKKSWETMLWHFSPKK